jgi:hypothetical protein
MPPKEQKAGEGDGVSHQYMWLLTYRRGEEYDEIEEGFAVFSSKEKAIAGLAAFMDKHFSRGYGDWKNGVEGFGKEDEKNIFQFEYFGDNVENDGLLLENDNRGNPPDAPCAVHLKRLKVDDP